MDFKEIFFFFYHPFAFQSHCDRSNNFSFLFFLCHTNFEARLDPTNENTIQERIWFQVELLMIGNGLTFLSWPSTLQLLFSISIFHFHFRLAAENSLFSSDCGDCLSFSCFLSHQPYSFSVLIDLIFSFTIPASLPKHHFHYHFSDVGLALLLFLIKVSISLISVSAILIPISGSLWLLYPWCFLFSVICGPKEGEKKRIPSRKW